MSEYNYKYLIIGGGILGCAIAYSLSNRLRQDKGDVSIALLDIDLDGGFSSTLKNAGGVRATWRNDANIQLCSYSIAFFEKIKEVPTARELGYEVTWANPNWWLAPKGTPQDRLDVIANAFKTIMADPEIQTWFSDRVLDPYWTDGEQARAESNELLVKLKAAAANIKK